MNQKARVLVVDDDSGVRHYLALLFKDWGHEVFFASSGEEVVEILETARPDIMTLSVSMSGMDGLETLKCILVARPDLTIKMVNRATLSLLGYSSEQLIDSPINRLFSSECPLRKASPETFAEQSAPSGNEATYLTKGSRRIRNGYFPVLS